MEFRLLIDDTTVVTAPVGGAAARLEPRRPDTRLPGRLAWLLLTLVVVVYGALTILSMRQTSTTFDEIIMSSAGARGYHTGDFDLIAQYHPRAMTYLYGLPIALSRPAYPPERAEWMEEGGSFKYARQLHFLSGNDGPALAFRARLVGVLCGAALVLVVFGFVRRYYGEVAAVLGAGMTAFLPDLLAHGGISYNDVPNALAFFGAVWGLDRAAARPTVRTALAAGALTGLALGVKYSAVALAPIGLCLLVLAAAAEGRGWQAYVRRVLPLLPLAVLAVYGVLVTLYLGDVTLASFRTGLEFNIFHASTGHGVPALLLGRRSMDGFWYFFPVALFIKTPAALHILIALAALGFGTVWRAKRAILLSPLRGPLVAGLVFLLFLLQSDLNIGFRHALPIVPCLLVVVAAGLGRLWEARGRGLRTAIVALVVMQAVSVTSWFPHFLPYTSEYFPDRDLGYTRISDSSHDWGQGLPLLGEFMREEGVSSVYLSYFGSAVPEAYGVGYVPLVSFFALEPQQPPARTRPRFAAISATSLAGSYIEDAFADFRRLEPYRVLGHSIFIFQVNSD